MNCISPLNLSGLRLTVERELANPSNESSADKRKSPHERVEEITRYMCVSCSEEHDYRSEAEECCPDEDEDKDAPGAVLKDSCPVCRYEHSSTEEAADCCLWKDMDKPARWRIAALVDGGKSWTESIEEVTGQKLNPFN